MLRYLATIVTATLFGAACGHAQKPSLNLDFEQRSPGTNGPAGWGINGEGIRVTLDSLHVQSGRLSLRTEFLGGEGLGTAVAIRQLPVELLRGRQVRYTGWIRTDAITIGYAGLWLRVDGPDGPLAFDNMALRGPRKTTGWTRYEVNLKVDTSATAVVFGVLHPGNGSAWFDDLDVAVDGQPLDLSIPVWTPTDAELAWLRDAAVPFVTERAGGSTADLKPLLELVGDARIVSLGEATHGTAEFFRMKHRITEALAREKGFTIFAIEANMPEARAINEYVLTGRGDARAALRGIYFWTWNTEEVLELIEWMRAYNASGAGRIEFWGFDMQTPGVAMDSVRAFVARADAAYLPELEKAYAKRPNDTRERRATAAEHMVFLGPARSVLDHMLTREAEYRLQHDSMTVAWAIQNARIVAQAAATSAGGGTAARDSAMAFNVRWMLDHSAPGAKAVLWAHNGHVQRQRPMMGAALDRLYGDAMRVVGFAFYEGDYTAVGARGLTTYTAAPAHPGSIEHALHTTGHPRLFLDLRGAAHRPASAWLAAPRPFRQLGAVASDDAFTRTILSQLFDALIYFERSTASKLLPRN